LRQNFESMKVQLTKTIAAEIYPNYVLQALPRWLFERTIIVGQYKSMDEHESHIAKTVGSYDYYYRSSDELRFGEIELLLESISFEVPELNVSSNLDPDRWNSVLPQEGIIRLSSSLDFYLEPVDCRWINPDGNYLLGLLNGWQDNFSNPYRLRIAKDLDLLFINKDFCGWMLSDPSNYLVGNLEFPQQVQIDRKLPSLVSEYLTLVTDDFVKRMEEEESQARNELVLLRSKIQVDKELSSQRETLLKRVEDLLEAFYGA
jgi:hypothetical protein